MNALLHVMSWTSAWHSQEVPEPVPQAALGQDNCNDHSWNMLTVQIIGSGAKVLNVKIVPNLHKLFLLPWINTSTCIMRLLQRLD